MSRVWKLPVDEHGIVHGAVAREHGWSDDASTTAVTRGELLPLPSGRSFVVILGSTSSTSRFERS